METHRVSALLKLLSAFCCLFLAVDARGATPGYTLAAANVSMSDMGSGASSFTLTSVNGFTGQVGVTCIGPDLNLLPDLVLPSCNAPVQNLVVPDNGTVSGTMLFNPPWSSQAALGGRGVSGRPGRAPLPLLMGLGGLACASLLGFPLRGRLSRWIVLTVVGVSSLAAVAGVTGCIGKGGLAMTPGTYSYVISGGSLKGQSATISVTVH